MTEKTIGGVPGSVEVITAEELAEMNADSVADALETATGLVVTTESGRVSAPDIRGTKSKHALILIDGRRLAAGFGELVDINQIPVLMVERIEIVRGPSSSLYGSDAIGGVVNIITRKPPKEGKVGARVQYGRDRNEEGTEYIGSVLAGDTFERLGVIAAGELRKKDGWDLVVNEQDDGDKEGEKSGIGRFALGFTDDHVLSGGFEFNEMSRQGLRYLENMTRDRDADDKRTASSCSPTRKSGRNTGSCSGSTGPITRATSRSRPPRTTPPRAATSST
jgi:outer membrane receptor for ferrienterochelin and colicins